MSNLVPAGWTSSKFGSLTKSIKSGLSRRIVSQDIGLPVLISGNIQNNNLDTSELKYWYVDDPQGADTSRYLLNDGDILLCFINSLAQIGKVCIYSDIGRATIYTTNLFRVVAHEDFSSSYVYQLMTNQPFQEEIQLITKPAVNQASFTKADLEEIPVIFPPLPEQKKIAAILTSVDDVIEKTQAQIDKLKDLKIGMMQELLTRGVGVDGKPHTEFKDSAVGKIPKGWDCVLMEAICTKITDGEHQTPKRTTEGYYLLSARNVRDGYIDVTNVDYVGDDEFQRISKRVSPKQGDILISCSGSVGRVAVVPPKLEFSMVRSVAILQLNKDIVDPYFMAVQIAATAIQDQIEKSLSQQAQANLFQGAIKKLVVVVPTMSEQKKIASAVNSIANKIAKLQDGLKGKQSLKRALMQDLLTGKKRVKVDS